MMPFSAIIMVALGLALAAAGAVLGAHLLIRHLTNRRRE